MVGAAEEVGGCGAGEVGCERLVEVVGAFCCLWGVRWGGLWDGGMGGWGVALMMQKRAPEAYAAVKLKVGCQLEMSKPGTWGVVEACAAAKKERGMSEGFILGSSQRLPLLQLVLVRIEHRSFSSF